MTCPVSKVGSSRWSSSKKGSFRRIGNSVIPNAEGLSMGLYRKVMKIGKLGAMITSSIASKELYDAVHNLLWIYHMSITSDRIILTKPI